MLINIEEQNPQLFSFVEELQQIKKLRQGKITSKRISFLKVFWPKFWGLRLTVLRWGQKLTFKITTDTIVEMVLRMITLKVISNFKI